MNAPFFHVLQGLSSLWLRCFAIDRSAQHLSHAFAGFIPSVVQPVHDNPVEALTVNLPRGYNGNIGYPDSQEERVLCAKRPRVWPIPCRIMPASG